MQLFVKSLIATSLSLAISSPVFADIEISGDVSSTVSSSENESVEDSLIIGQTGNAQGTIDSGSVLESSDAILGQGTNSTGSVTITGNGSAWNSSGSIMVGDAGSGMLTITDGGTLQADVLDIGHSAPGNGSVTVSGTGSSVTVSNLNIGASRIDDHHSGDGNLLLSDGAVVEVMEHTDIGFKSLGGKNKMTVEGQSQFSTDTISVYGNGTLDITDGSTVRGRLMHINSHPLADSVAHVHVTGEGSLLDMQELMLGLTESGGELTVSDNATVSAGRMMVGLLNFDGITSSVNIGGQKGQAAAAPGYITSDYFYLGSAFAELNFNHTSDAYLFDTPVLGNGNINNLAGVTLLNADNSAFLGKTNVSGGTLISNQGLGGDVNITSGGTMIAGAHIGGSVTNAGILKVGVAADNGIETTNDTRGLEIYGDYTGNNGTLALDSVLGGDDSATDFLSIYGNTYGTTRVVVNNLGGSGAQTLNGIPVIKVGGSSEGEFIQQGRIAAGAFDYQLARMNGDWILNSSLTPQPPPEVPSELEPQPDVPSDIDPQAPSEIVPEAQPESRPDLKNMAVRPEAGAYSTNMAAANTLFTTRLHDRLGETHYVDALTGQNEVTSLWMRHEGGHNRSKDSSGQLATQANRYVMQLGGDIAQWSSTDEDRFHLGVMGGYASQKSNTRNTYTGNAASGNINGYGAGLYGTWLQDNADKTGIYVDSWLHYSWFNNTVSGDSLSTERYKSRGLTASVESGYTAKVADTSKTDAVYIQPKAQATWMGVKADDLQESNGTRVQSRGDGNVQTRLGVRTFIKHEDGAQKFEPFVEANWLHNTTPFGTTMDGVEISQAGTRDIGELKAGVEGQLSRNVNIWGNVAQQVGDKGYSDTAAMIGLKVNF